MAEPAEVTFSSSAERTCLERVDAYFQGLRTTGLLIRNLEEKAEPTQPWAGKRAAKIAAVVKLGQDARGLLEEVNRTW